jgi:hypothetical protein
MKNPADIDLATELQLALTEAYPDSTFGAVPITEQYDALVSYRAADDEALAEIPGAFAAHLDYQRKQWG